ncbi:MAG TPA: YggT family protein [Anaerolineales bacterium]
MNEPVQENEVRAAQDRKFREKQLTKRQIVLRKTTNFVWWFTGIVEGLIGLRVVLRMMAANPGNPFADFVYALSGLFLWPFQTLVNNPSAEGGVVLEVSSIIAMMVYLLLAWVFVELLWLLLGRERV